MHRDLLNERKLAPPHASKIAQLIAKITRLIE
jgi:hypothetical protein